MRALSRRRMVITEALEPRRLLSSNFVVAPNGSNANPGTLAQPFATIQHAADVAQAGDTVYIRGGTYRETVTPAHSGTASAPIIFEPYNGESVTVSGADVVGNWAASGNSIYSTTPGWNLGEGSNQVFVDGTMMGGARSPNNPNAADFFHYPTYTIDSATTTASPNGPFGNTETATIQSSALNDPPNAWVGATVHIAPGEGWVWQTGTVIASQPGSITYQYTQLNLVQQFPSVGDPFYLTGKLYALDSPGEWVLDPASGALYVRTPQNDSPASHTVEMKHRQFTFDLSGRSNVTVRGINLFAATINTSAASNNLM
ncbi:MAG TPA: hypothetical protein VIM11_18955, partial [Tepidisphaeraceae bacterium]